MSVFGVRKKFSDVNTPKTSISASVVYICNILNIFFTINAVHLYKQMLYRDIWMETPM